MPQYFFHGLYDPQANQKYLNQTEIAKNKKIFGSPTFIYNDEVFWGDDRLEDCIKWSNLN